MSDNKEYDFCLKMSRRSVKIVVIVGMFSVLLTLISLSVLVTEASAMAGMSKQIKTLEHKLKDLEENQRVANKK
ncbi:DUF5408 family protein [Helicobacter cappadocius]|uniref:DUF5408 family protein n=1 Tax=Helicobacter cappadocius TaxID=3063998 RepID=A0AA90PWG5_9HELI|nr:MULTISPECIES: DUF5408 family protein [unclassified Helicobacter]MDO7253647.1 DUF5408 family protein [Helicobacter sp. faydin-H75]MDP2539575.1 DUF5408 family protein [Helicobacter sp. faydin-H76]